MIGSWAAQEAASACFNDKRLDRRMALLLSAMGDKPNLSIPAACRGRAEMHAAYRFFDNDKVTFQSVLAPHVQRSLGRMADERVVLLVQDTTEVDLTRPESVVEGLGTLQGQRRGLLLHVMHAFTPTGTPLGTVWGQYINRPARGPGRLTHRQAPRRRKRTPIEQKESLRWLSGLKKAREIAEALPGVQCVCVADSEADIYECLAEPRSDEGGRGLAGRFDWLIRGCYDRVCQDPDPAGSIRQQVLATAVLDRPQVHVRRRQAKIAVDKQARHQKREGRVAQVELRAASMVLRPPRRPDRQLPPMPLQVVLVSEVYPPAGEVPIEWLLLSTLPIDTLDQVRLIVQYYCVRWNIEVFFRTLKSGCRIERRRFEHLGRVLPALSFYLIVAWRTLWICHLSRQYPDADCEVVFEPSEWKAVWMTTTRQQPPRTTPSLRQIVHLIAQLGGYVERPNSEPGSQTIWIGLQRMNDLALAWDAFGPKTRGGP